MRFDPFALYCFIALYYLIDDECLAGVAQKLAYKKPPCRRQKPGLVEA